MLSPSTPDPVALPPGRTGLIWRLARALWALLLVAFTLAVFAWLTLQWGILPRIDEWRPQIEQRASAALGQAVRIGAIRVQSGGWVPALDLRDVKVLDAAGRTALELGQVRVSLAPQSLLVLEPRLAQLHLDGVNLDIRRDAQGRIRIAGLDVQSDAGTGDEGAAADWLFAQGEIVVRRGSVRWTDELRAAPALELSDVQVVLRNGLRTHQLRVDATPPPDWGQRFSLRGQFTQPLLARRGDWRRWSGSLHADLPAADVAELRRHVTLPFELDGGRGAVRAWLELREGQWRELTADVALADVSARMGPNLRPLALTQLSTLVHARRDDAGTALKAQRLTFATAEGLHWPAADIEVSWVSAAAAAQSPASSVIAGVPVAGGQMRASRLDLAQMSAIASRLPLGAAVQRSLAALAPSGVASDLAVRWSGPLDAPQTYSAQGRVAGLSLAPLAAADPGHIGRPGLSGADIEFEADQSGGKASLAMRRGSLHFPGVFEQATVPLDKLAAKLDWSVSRSAAGAAASMPAIELRVGEASFANADVQGELRGVWRTGKATAAEGGGFGAGAWLPGQIDMNGRIQRARGTRVAAYLPLGIPSAARSYVARAVRGGSVDSATFAVKGDVWQFPYHRTPGGVFRIAAKVRDAQFDYLPSTPAGEGKPAWQSPWPAFTDVQGELVVDRNSLQLNGVQARLWGTQLRQVQARIADLADHPVLEIEGEGRGPLADMLRYVDTTPVGGWLHGGLKPITAAGAGDLQLALRIPLAEPERTTVQGSIMLGGNDVRIRPGTPLLARARGRIEFTHRGFEIKGGHASLLGGEASFEGGMKPGAAMHFTGQGMASAEGLRSAAELGLLPLVATHLRGQTSYRLALGIVDGGADVSVTSDLVGLESGWPAPLGKAAATPWPTRWHAAPASPGAHAAAAGGAGALEALRLDVGPVLQLRLLRDVAGEQARILAGTVGVLEAAPQLAAGRPAEVQARMTLAAVDGDAWWRAWQRAVGNGEGAAGLPALHALIHADSVLLAERRFTAATIDIHHDPLATEMPWRAQARSAQAAGQAAWRPSPNLADPGRLEARLVHLALPPSEALVLPPGSAQPATALQQPMARMPALDIVVDEFEHRGRKLGKLEVQAHSRPALARAGATEWRLDKLALTVPEAQLKARGDWGAPQADGLRRMAMEFTLDTSDSGRLASRFGLKDAMRGGKGRLQGALAWMGAPQSPEFASMHGKIHVDLEAGQFMHAEPGVGRLLGILSLQSLPRRLLLDFRDVFQEGFSFDSVRGDIEVVAGQARTDNLEMRAVQATVLMAGSADLQHETQDLRVTVVPEVNAGAASLAYAAVNPAVGLGTFVAQMVLRDPLREAGTREFHITGPLADPKVERIERAASGPPPAPTQPAKESPG